jgi:hypothetical protein
VAPHCSWHNLCPFAFFLTFEYFLDCLKYQGVGPFDYVIGLRMVYKCECHLCSNLLTKVLEHCVVNAFCIVYYDVAGDVVMTNAILPEKLLDGCGANIRDKLRLNPLCEVFHCHNGEGVIPLSWGQLADNIDAPIAREAKMGQLTVRVVLGPSFTVRIFDRLRMWKPILLCH